MLILGFSFTIRRTITIPTIIRTVAALMLRMPIAKCIRLNDAGKANQINIQMKFDSNSYTIQKGQLRFKKDIA